MIYIVEDDSAIRELEQYALQSSGYETASFESGESFWQAMRTAEPELVILDVMLPGEDGFSILKKLRNTPSLRRLPIIMITAKSSELDTVRGLDCGADDYIAKPFGIMEFLSRVRAALRRSAPQTRPNVYSFHELMMDNARHSVTVNGEDVELTYKEYSLLRLLLENTNLVVTRETILQVVWGTDIPVESRTVDMHIRTLRKKLGSAGGYILTVRKVGYKLADAREGSEE
ncbi:MAG: response regulator transcription factor [Candidatus Faecalibacterium intestinavium]|uniref:Stage 0 sporulation protein A homolog n=1 Tax=Candidatus Faecalibacterium intestinavium TaxID=2838580 RepID=A0A9E2NRG6_9FIRM|nr:response regulator transcription factor [Candidatus Faecalibacterium intestinavium]